MALLIAADHHQTVGDMVEGGLQGSQVDRRHLVGVGVAIGEVGRGDVEGLHVVPHGGRVANSCKQLLARLARVVALVGRHGAVHVLVASGRGRNAGSRSAHGLALELQLTARGEAAPLGPPLRGDERSRCDRGGRSGLNSPNSLLSGLLSSPGDSSRGSSALVLDHFHDRLQLVLQRLDRRVVRLASLVLPLLLGSGLASPLASPLSSRRRRSSGCMEGLTSPLASP